RAEREKKRHGGESQKDQEQGHSALAKGESGNGQGKEPEDSQQQIQPALSEQDGQKEDGKKTKEKKQKKQPRASTTDPQARVMKMADGGFRPAYNVQVASIASE